MSGTKIVICFTRYCVTYDPYEKVTGILLPFLATPFYSKALQIAKKVKARQPR